MEINSELLRKRLRSEMNDLADTVSGGACQDFPSYRHMVGVIEGLARAERALLDMVKTAEKLQGGEDE